MKYQAEIDVMPLKELLDPQGKAVASNMTNVGIPEITEVRIGKHILIHLDAPDKETANAKVDIACKKLLSNPIIESYTFTLSEV